MLTQSPRSLLPPQETFRTWVCVFRFRARSSPPQPADDCLVLTTDSLVMLEPPTVSSVQALQTRHFLAQAIKTTFDPSSPPSTTRNSTNLVFLSGLFEYLVGGLQSACDSYDRHLAFDTMSAAEKEELYLQYADLLYRHASSPHSTFQPVQIRTVLEQAIKAFPSNTTLLAYYAATESRMRYQNRVRKVLDDVVLSPTAGAKGPNGFLFAIWAELRAVKGRHNEWAVRSLFERAFDRPEYAPPSSCPPLHDPDLADCRPTSTVLQRQPISVPLEAGHRTRDVPR